MGIAHSKLGASSYERWATCPGSVRLCATVPNVSSKYAEEGTKAHELLETVLYNRFVSISPMRTMVESEPEMLEAVLTAYRYVAAIMEPNPDAVLLLEQRFDLSSIYPGCFGTSDVVIYLPSKKHLIVMDYKHGAGVPVEVEKNKQLLYYGLGALLNLPQFKPVTVELVIAQPRAFHKDGPIRSWSCEAIDLIDFAADLVEAARRTESLDAPLVPSEKGCRFCSAAAICPALHQVAVTSAQEEFGAVANYDPQKLSETLAKLDLIEDYAKSVRAFAYSEAEHGRPPPGWKLVQKRASRKWRGSDVETLEGIIDSGAFLNFDLSTNDLYTREFKSVAQVEKLLPKEHRKILEPLVKSVSSGLALAPESDPRPAAKADIGLEFLAEPEPQETDLFS